MTDPAADNPFARVPITITVSVGHARPAVRELLRLTRDSILTLDRKVDDPVELWVGDRLIGHGALTELEGENAGQLAVRITAVADLARGL